jgi:putative endonuclease
MRSYWTYILASKPRGTLYIGVTNGLILRVEQHRAGKKGSAFTRKYEVHTLVWFEEFADVRQAIQCEKTLKHYTRA